MAETVISRRNTIMMISKPETDLIGLSDKLDIDCDLSGSADVFSSICFIAHWLSEVRLSSDLFPHLSLHLLFFF